MDLGSGEEKKISTEIPDFILLATLKMNNIV